MPDLTRLRRHSHAPPLPPRLQTPSAVRIEPLATDSDAVSEASGSLAPTPSSLRRRRVQLSAERTAELHQRFRDLPKDEVVAADFSASLQKEIPIHGRLYVTTRLICFYSSLFGWITSAVIPFSDVISIEKKNRPIFVRSGIQIATLNAKYYFAAFVNRDLAFNRLVGFWRNSQQPQPLSAEEVLGIDETFQSESESVFSDDDASAEEYARRERSQSLSVMETPRASSPAPVAESTPATPVASRSRTLSSPDDGATATNGQPGAAASDSAMVAASSSNANGASATSASASQPALPASAAPPKPDRPVDPKEFGYQPFKTPVIDATIAAPLKTIYTKLFDPADQFLRSFLREKQRMQDLEIDPWNVDAKGQETREYRYVMLLNQVMGPKSTRVFNRQRCLAKDLERCVIIENSSETPDVPSGDCFRVMNLYCLSYVDPNRTRLIVTGQVNFSKSTWIKSFIETHSTEGFIQYGKDLERELRADLEPKAPGAPAPSKAPAEAAAPAPAPAEEPVVEAEPPAGLVAKAHDLLQMAGIKVEREHVPRLIVVVLLAIMLIVQVNSLLHLGRTSRALARLELEATQLRAACPAISASGPATSLAPEWQARFDDLASRLQALERTYGKAHTTDEL